MTKQQFIPKGINNITINHNYGILLQIHVSFLLFPRLELVTVIATQNSLQNKTKRSTSKIHKSVIKWTFDLEILARRNKAWHDICTRYHLLCSIKKHQQCYRYITVDAKYFTVWRNKTVYLIVVFTTISLLMLSISLCEETQPFIR